MFGPRERHLKQWLTGLRGHPERRSLWMELAAHASDPKYQLLAIQLFKEECEEDDASQLV